MYKTVNYHFTRVCNYACEFCFFTRYFGKATLKASSATATTKKFTLSVPIGDTKETEVYKGEATLY